MSFIMKTIEPATFHSSKVTERNSQGEVLSHDNWVSMKRWEMAFDICKWSPIPVIIINLIDFYWGSINAAIGTCIVSVAGFKSIEYESKVMLIKYDVSL